jgi:exonuclease III
LALKTSLATIYDIITISETHIHAGVPNNVFDLKDYHDTLRKDRGARGGGVAIYIKEEISYRRIFKYETPKLEAI